MPRGSALASYVLSPHSRAKLDDARLVSNQGNYIETAEGLVFAAALAYYSRIRFIENLLPLLREASSLRRVVNVLAGTKEGTIDTNNWATIRRGHVVSMMTLSLETFAKTAPEVSFIHSYPGFVKTNLIRGGEGALVATMGLVFSALEPFFTVPNEECGERHAFLATSARYPPGSDAHANAGVPLGNGVAAAKGTDGKFGSGVYSVDSQGESAGPKTVALLAKLRQEGMPEAVLNHTQGEFSRATKAKK